MDDLNAKVGSRNNLLGHVMGKHGLADRSGKGGMFMDFWMDSYSSVQISIILVNAIRLITLL